MVDEALVEWMNIKMLLRVEREAWSSRSIAHNETGKQVQTVGLFVSGSWGCLMC